jgi:hypothetical protein
LFIGGLEGVFCGVLREEGDEFFGGNCEVLPFLFLAMILLPYAAVTG